MRKLEIDFGPPRRSILHLVGGVMLLCAAALVAWDIWRYTLLIQARHTHRLEQDQLQNPVNVPASRTGSGIAAPSKEDVLRAVQAADRLNTPWDSLFESVEGAMDGQSVLLGMEPDMERRELRLRIEAKDMDAMLHCLKRIDAAPGLHGAYLEMHQVFLQDPQHPVRFTVLVRWTIPVLPAAPVDVLARTEERP